MLHKVWLEAVEQVQCHPEGNLIIGHRLLWRRNIVVHVLRYQGNEVCQNMRHLPLKAEEDCTRIALRKRQGILEKLGVPWDPPVEKDYNH